MALKEQNKDDQTTDVKNTDTKQSKEGNIIT